MRIITNLNICNILENKTELRTTEKKAKLYSTQQKSTIKEKVTDYRIWLHINWTAV